MSFISNSENFTLGEGVYNNIHNSFIHNTFYGKKRHREAIEDAPGLLSLEEPTRKRRRREEEEGIKVIRNKHLKLTLELGSGPGYFLHAGEAKGRAVIVKVFNAGSTVREQLESTVALSKGLMHPNVLRIEGVSSPASLNHFIAYENAHWRTAEGPLAAALKDDLTRSVNLGFKMVAGLSSGMNHLSVQGVSLASLGVENFDVFLDLNDRFLISVNPPTSSVAHVTEDLTHVDNTTISWDVFNALCQKVLRSANRVLHNEDIERKPVVDLGARPHEVSTLAANSASESLSSPRITEDEPPVRPRREYVWRTIDRGQQSLANVASRISHDLDMELYSLSKLTWSHMRSAHRCAGYVREEITLATTMGDSAVVSHDAPCPLEVCCICHEVVGVHEVFRCICDDPRPGSRTTVKCQACKFWSHSACVGNPKEFTCQLCSPAESKTVIEVAEPVPATLGDTSQHSTSRDNGEGITRQSPARDIFPVSGTSSASELLLAQLEEKDEEDQLIDDDDDVVPPLVVPPVVPTSSAADSSSKRKAPSKRKPRKSEKKIAEEDRKSKEKIMQAGAPSSLAPTMAWFEVQAMGAHLDVGHVPFNIVSLDPGPSKPPPKKEAARNPPAVPRVRGPEFSKRKPRKSEKKITDEDRNSKEKTMQAGAPSSLAPTMSWFEDYAAASRLNL
ncbi:hypothetical protein DFH09DRAFT_83731 [Mycena vulgaris]|nr:hypothetical protein DFH09DRAFT_83731 [Mycena vulgaris]